MANNSEKVSRSSAREPSPLAFPYYCPLPEYAEPQADEAEERFLWLFNMSADAILICADNRLVMANAAATGLLGASSSQELSGRLATELMPWLARREASRALGIQRRKPLFVERLLVRLDGVSVHAMVAEQACHYQGRPAMQLLAREISRHSSMHGGTDTLTGLPDRIRFRERMKRAIVASIEHQQPIALLRLAIDDFRKINTMLGQQDADMVLKKVAQRLQASMRDQDMAARLGGDEFGILLEGLSDPGQAGQIAQRILDRLSRPLLLDSQKFGITASVGIAISPDDATEYDRLLHQAELAMSHGRKRGLHGWCRYSPDIEHHGTLELSSRAAIEQRYSRLTAREREVLNLLVAGKANKMIAYLLGTSTRTIENHRARIMDKMQAKSLPELVQTVLLLRSRQSAQETSR